MLWGGRGGQKLEMTRPRTKDRYPHSYALTGLHYDLSCSNMNINNIMCTRTKDEGKKGQKEGRANIERAREGVLRVARPQQQVKPFCLLDLLKYNNGYKDSASN